MCFSATIPPQMKQVFSHVLKPNHAKISTIDASEPPTLEKVPQFSLVVPSAKDTFTALYSLLQEEIQSTEGDPKIIVFGTTAKIVALFAEVFQRQLGLEVFELHSRLSQSARTRTTDAFKTARRGIMFASDGKLLFHDDQTQATNEFGSHWSWDGLSQRIPGGSSWAAI